MFEITVRPNTGNPDHACIIIRGEITLANADRIFREVCSTSETYPSIEITLEEVENIDISMIQLFCAAGKSLEKFRVNVQLNTDLEVLLDHAGLLSIVN